MTEQAKDDIGDSPHANAANMGFFEKVLHRQLNTSDTGCLKIKSPSGKSIFGEGDNQASVSYTHLTLPTTPYV